MKIKLKELRKIIKHNLIRESDDGWGDDEVSSKPLKAHDHVPTNMQLSDMGEQDIFTVNGLTKSEATSQFGVDSYEFEVWHEGFDEYEDAIMAGEMNLPDGVDNVNLDMNTHELHATTRDGKHFTWNHYDDAWEESAPVNESSDDGWGDDGVGDVAGLKIQVRPHDIKLGGKWSIQDYSLASPDHDIHEWVAEILNKSVPTYPDADHYVYHPDGSVLVACDQLGDEIATWTDPLTDEDQSGGEWIPE